MDFADIASCYIAENKQFQNFSSLHYHRVNELYYILDGKGDLILEDVRLPIKKSDLILIRPNEDHIFINEPGDLLHLYCIYFSDDVLNYLEEDHTLMKFVQGLDRNSRVISIQEDSNSYDLLLYFREIIFEQNNQTEESNLLMKLLLTAILIKIKQLLKLDKNYHTSINVALSSTERSVLKVIQYIERNYYKNLPLEELASKVPLGTRQFTRIFHKLTNKPFKEYIQKLRIDNAKSLLSTRQKEIKSVCFEVGFEDLSHFYRVFRKFTGTTPKNYVLSLQAKQHTSDNIGTGEQEILVNEAS